MNSGDSYFNPNFTHIYVEKKVSSHFRTREILARFPRSQVVLIDHYKDVFNRRGQNPTVQHRSQCLILAAKEGNLFYEGAPVCQDFGNANFYYCSTMMNCVFDCSYCYLKGMYPSGHLVVFVNLEDYFETLDRFLREQSMYLCVSYDADLLAVESFFGYGKLWARYAAAHENLKIEIRTKSANPGMWEELPEAANVIYAFTLAPQQMIRVCESGTPSVGARLACALSGIAKGFPVRLCFDPMLYLPTWREDYRGLLDELDRAFFSYGLSMDVLTDVSVGTFRISREYMKQLRRVLPDAPAVQFPYVNSGGVYQYPQALLEEMEQYLVSELEKRMDREKIYRE